jgi:glycosyltransferase involved in cell wall biosynthesis
MIKHISPPFNESDGVSAFGRDIDKLILALPADIKEKDIVHFEIGNGSINELWQAWNYRNRPFSQKLVLTLHDPPVVVAKPFKKFLSSSNVFIKTLRKALDLTAGKLIIRRLLKNADAVIVLNPLAKESMIKKFGLKRERAHFMHLPNLLGAPCDVKEDGSLLFFGNLAQHKGLDILIQAYKSLPSRDTAVKLIIAGGWGDNVLYRKKIEHLAGGNPTIHFTGRVSDKQLQELVGKAKVVILPYRDPGIIHASGPLVTAMAAGKPVLASDIPIFSGFIKPNQNGLLFEEGNPDDLKLKLLKLLESSEFCHQLGIAAKEYAEKEFSLRKIEQELKTVYKSL